MCKCIWTDKWDNAVGWLHQKVWDIMSCADSSRWRWKWSPSRWKCVCPSSSCECRWKCTNRIHISARQCELKHENRISKSRNRSSALKNNWLECFKNGHSKCKHWSISISTGKNARFIIRLDQVPINKWLVVLEWRTPKDEQDALPSGLIRSRLNLGDDLMKNRNVERVCVCVCMTKQTWYKRTGHQPLFGCVRLYLNMSRVCVCLCVDEQRRGKRKANQNDETATSR